MKSRYPQFHACVKSNRDIEFTGELSVKPEFRKYIISITYRGAREPEVRVLSPLLVDNPPHFYSNTKSLCLYHPDNYNWTEDKLIAKEIVPWTAAWIYFYEIWLETGIWYGPEVSHKQIK